MQSRKLVRERRIKANALLTTMLSLLLTSAVTLMLSIQSFGIYSETSAFGPDFPSDRPLIYVDPPLLNQTVGSTFTVSVRIFNLTDNKVVKNETIYPLGNLYGLEFRFSWNFSALEYVRHNLTTPIEAYPNGVLHDPVFAYRNVLNTTAGTYDIAFASGGNPPAPPFNNPRQSNSVFNMTFRVKKEGLAMLELGGTPPATFVKLAAASEQPYPLILHEKRDGLVAASAPPVPTANFTYFPTAPLPGEETAFNATLSTPNDGSIVNYVWDFGDGTAGTGTVTTHAYSSLGKHTVTLNVTNSEGFWDIESKSIEVLSQRTITQEFMVDDITFSVDVTSNSTILSVILDASERSLRFNATGPNGTVGFAEVVVPLNAMSGPWTILVDDGSALDTEQTTNATHTLIYLTYNQSTRKIVLVAAEIVPEFAAESVLLVVLMAVTVAWRLTSRSRGARR